MDARLSNVLLRTLLMVGLLVSAVASARARGETPATAASQPSQPSVISAPLIPGAVDTLSEPITASPLPDQTPTSSPVQSPSTATVSTDTSTPPSPQTAGVTTNLTSPLPSPSPVQQQPDTCVRTVTADVVAINVVITYNRFGSLEPSGEMYALRRDVVGDSPGAQLRRDKRPRPIVLRVNEGDCLKVHFTNLLNPNSDERPATRTAGMHVNGLDYVGSILSDGAFVGTNPPSIVPPGQSITYTWFAAKQGQYLVYSQATTSGGDGDGGQIVRGLFGSINVEPKNSRSFRSQVSAETMRQAQKRDANGAPVFDPQGHPVLDFEARDQSGRPLLSITDPLTNEIVHTDLNAIITDPSGQLQEDCTKAPPSGTCGQPFREFTVLFHDEVEDDFPSFSELKFRPFESIKDGFGINYGVSGMGSILFANRFKVGPSRFCGECPYEEFFLEAWPNGDPATLIEDIPGQGKHTPFPDDPSNVHHSYLNDPVRFRNIHAGPKETHVFHLHAHQWLQSPRDENSTYLDAQTISPGASFTYEIQYGGSGNRNLTPGDAIFHCHLYPHFAQGMWELWRVHDVFEDGTPGMNEHACARENIDPETGQPIPCPNPNPRGRNLPDGEVAEGIQQPAIVPIPNLFLRARQGVPVVPAGLPPMPRPDFQGYPFYAAGRAGHRPPQPPLGLEKNGGLPRHRVEISATIDGIEAVPEFRRTDPVAARVHELADDGYKPWTFFFARELEEALLAVVPDAGTPDEIKAMQFHAGQDAATGPSVPFRTEYDWLAQGYQTLDATGKPGLFLVNGRAQKPGAPYADPCPDTFRDGNNLTRPVTTRNYRAAWIEIDNKFNKAGWHDRQGRLTVLEDDVAATFGASRPNEPLGGTGGPKPSEPFFIRVNSGECVDYRATNLVPAVLNLDDFMLYQSTDMIGQHIHLVKFDVTSSDGAENGWNYESGAFSPETVRERIEAAAKFAAAHPNDPRLPPPMQPEVNPKFAAVDPTGGLFAGAQTLIERWWADPLINNENRDRTIRTSFTHDHFSPSGHQHHGLYGALIVEPTDSVYTTQEGVPMGTRPDGGPTSFSARVIAGPSGQDSFREFALAIGDFALAYTAEPENVPVNPPNFDEAPLPLAIANPEPLDPRIKPLPEAISSNDPGTMVFNYRNEPIPHRIGALNPAAPPIDLQDGGHVEGPRFTQLPGPAGDMAFVFSSAVHGDPATPVLGVFPGDRISVKMIQGAQEEQHVFHVHGQKWFFEPGTPNDPLAVNNSGFNAAQQIGIAEHFEYEINERVPTSLGQKDFLYQSAPTDDLWNGMWGIMRAFASPQPGIAPLPNNPTLGATLPVNPLSSGLCPVGVGAPPLKTFQVQAVLASTLTGPQGIVYSQKFGHHDPAGIVFVETKDIGKIQAGAKRLEPLVLRANAGDCVQVTLTNALPPVVPEYDSWNEVPAIVPAFNFNQVKESNRVSMHTELLTYDAANSDGATVGFNPDQTVGPGESKIYAWYAGSISTGTTTTNTVLTPVEYGVVTLRDYGDIIKHSSHGLIGSLVIEPAGATAITDADTNAAATILGASGQVLFREFVVQYQTDVTAQDALGEPLPNFRGGDDPEDSGQKGFNYRHEPLWARLALPPDVDLDTLNGQDFTNTLSSTAPNPGCPGGNQNMVLASMGGGGACGDPETPVFTAQAGTPVRFRVIDVQGHPRQEGFTVFGHHWNFEPWTANSTVQGRNPFTFEVGSYSGIGPTRHLNILIDSAGGINKVPGDYLYRTQESFKWTGGLWGIFRVTP
jgi:hypothetical protein